MKLKAIDALITTILIIIISIILIAIILAWSKNFTQGTVNKADELINEKCDQATIRLTDCSITDDGNIIFQIKNTSTNYDFESQDTFKVLVFLDTGELDSEKELTLASGTWNGLQRGQSIIAEVSPITPSFTEGSGAMVNVTVRSTICPLTSTTITGCHR